MMISLAQKARFNRLVALTILKYRPRTKRPIRN
jgi:hypothetical protein